MEEPCFDVLRTQEQLGYYHSYVLKNTADLFLKGPIYITTKFSRDPSRREYGCHIFAPVNYAYHVL